MTREFEYNQGVRASVPLILALSGCSGSGKTKSALRLATGIQSVTGRDIAVIDTESGRALHYADEHKFMHVPFTPPYGPDQYASVLDFVLSKTPGVVIFDQFSSEHDGIGGVLELHSAELDRMAGDDWRRREACNMAGWIKPKQMRRQLINKLVQVGAKTAFIMLFRAKDVSKPVKKPDGKTVIEDQGIIPIAGAEYLYEATASCILPPASEGTPFWQTEFKGERMFMKLPGQFRDILGTGKQLDENMGRLMAEWARGGTASKQAQPETQKQEKKKADTTPLLESIHKALAAATKDCASLAEAKAKMAELSTKYFKAGTFAELKIKSEADLENGLLSLKAELEIL